MKKEDLQPGQIVKFKAGNIGIMIGTTAVGTDEGTSSDLMHDECISKGNYPITEVYTVNPSTELNAGLDFWFKYDINNLLSECTLVWEASKPIEEMTLDQVCKALGREIKLIK